MTRSMMIKVLTKGTPTALLFGIKKASAVKCGAANNHRYMAAAFVLARVRTPNPNYFPPAPTRSQT